MYTNRRAADEAHDWVSMTDGQAEALAELQAESAQHQRDRPLWEIHRVLCVMALLLAFILWRVW